jgi:hypothetical protein
MNPNIDKLKDAIVRGKGGATGVALVEVYGLQ